jgi:hypothetical protein
VDALRAIGPAAAAARDPLLEIVRMPAHGSEDAAMCVTYLNDLPAFVRKLRSKADPLSSFLSFGPAPEKQGPNVFIRDQSTEFGDAQSPGRF